LREAKMVKEYLRDLIKYVSNTKKPTYNISIVTTWREGAPRHWGVN